MDSNSANGFFSMRRECRGDGRQSLVHIVHLFWLSVESICLDSGVVHTVLLAPDDADLHLEPELHCGHPLEILDTGRDVLLVKFLAQIQHVTREQGLTVGMEILLICLIRILLQSAI